MAIAMSMASSSSSSATVAVEKATSDLLIGPDWTMNIDICDSVNSNRWVAKDVVKAVKKKLQHKNPKVQLLALTLLETMVKNCGDYVHFQIAERNILGEMVKIVKKKTNMHVRDKIMVLLDSWQEAFRGRGGKLSQYYWAYEDLRHAGVEFPQRSLNVSPIFTSPIAHSTMSHAKAGYGMSTNSSRRLDEKMATEFEGLTLSGFDSMWNVMELLNDMLQAVNIDDREALKDEIIVDLVNRCRSNQKQLMQMLTTTGEEELLDRGLKLNDNLQVLLAKHDAIASGSPMPTQLNCLGPKQSESYSSNISSTEAKDSCPSSSSKATVSAANITRSPIGEEDEEEDDFAQLARRHSKTHSSPSQIQFGTSKALVPVGTNNATSSTTTFSTPAPIRTTEEQDIIDLLSITLSTPSHHPQTTHTPTAANQSPPQVSASSTQGRPYFNQGQATYNNYVVPWAQPQSQHQLQVSSQPILQPQIRQQLQPHHQFQSQPHAQLQQKFQHQSQPNQHTQPQQQFQSQIQSQPQPQPQPQQQFQSQSQPQPHTQPQQQFKPHSQLQLLSKYPEYSYGYHPPPWAATPGYVNGQSRMSTNIFTTPQANTGTSSRGRNGLAMNGDPIVNSGPRNQAPPGQKPFIPSYRLFEDLNVLGNTDGRFKMSGSTSPSLSGPSSKGMVGGRK